jgi:hypothetical protein
MVLWFYGFLVLWFSPGGRQPPGGSGTVSRPLPA